MADEDEAAEDPGERGMTRTEGQDSASVYALSRTHTSSTRRELPAYYVPSSYPNKVLSLPAELTSRIFELIDSDWVMFMKHYYVIDDQDESTVPLRPGFTFLHVCMQWRRVALGYKKLWATFLHVTPNKLISLPLLTFYLEHSNPQPLDIVIRAQNFYWLEGEEDELDADSEKIQYDDDHEDSEHSYLPWTTTDVRRVLDALLTHAPRWRQFALNICIGGFDTAVLSTIQSIDAPLLQSFEVLTHNQWRGETLRSIPDKENLIISLRGDEPEPLRQRITVKRLTSARFDVLTLHMLAPSFAELTVLELRNSHFIRLPRKVYTNIFESAPRLVNVSFMRCHVVDTEFDEELDEDEDEELTMHAPCLEVLRSFASDMSMYMWKYLEAPQLKDVVISDASLRKLPLWIMGAWDDTFEADQVQTPFPSLERLVLENCNREKPSKRHLLLICRLTRSIEQLVLIRDEYMLAAMLRTGNNPLLWPNLRVLKLARSCYVPGLNSHSGDVSSLASLVQWRQAALGMQCKIEIDTAYYSIPNMNDDEPPEEEFWLGVQENIAQFNALVHRGLAQMDPCNDRSKSLPIWPPPAGQERPTHISDLWYVEMLGARNNPWY